MDAALADELRALRARAYGHDADLAHDPEAMRRLRELESLRRESPDAATSATRIDRPHGDGGRDGATQLTPAAPAHASGIAQANRAAESNTPVIDAAQVPRTTRDDDDSDTDLTVALGFDPDPDLDSEPDPKPEPAPAEPRALSRRLIALWIGSVIAAAAVASALTSTVVSIAPVSISSGAAQVDTLSPSSSPAFQPDDLGGAEDSPVWEYHGVTLFLGVDGTSATDESECLWLFVSDPGSSDSDMQVSGLGGWGSTGCSAGGFPATITLPFRDDLPDELLAAFPDGRALQFVLDGDRIGVFLDRE